MSTGAMKFKNTLFRFALWREKKHPNDFGEARTPRWGTEEKRKEELRSPQLVSGGLPQ
jgi:hypothetical protein